MPHGGGDAHARHRCSSRCLKSTDTPGVREVGVKPTRSRHCKRRAFGRLCHCVSRIFGFATWEDRPSRHNPQVRKPGTGLRSLGSLDEPLARRTPGGGLMSRFLLVTAFVAFAAPAAAATLTGTVQDPDGRAVAGAHVIASGARPGRAEVVTDQN